MSMLLLAAACCCLLLVLLLVCLPLQRGPHMDRRVVHKARQEG